MKKFFIPIFYFLLVVVFFWQFLFKGLLPIPSDTIVGLYYPFRDIYAKTNPNGVPFKNFLITDPVRQQYPWKALAINIEKKKVLPTWNPYNFAGTPLLANLQSASLYPLNILFFGMQFDIAWSIIIFLQPLLAGLFLYLYLNNLKLNKSSSLLGAIVFSFSGFSIAWLEWGTILNTALWLPLILLSVDKLFFLINKGKVFNKDIVKWLLVFTLSLVFSFFAGHLQIFSYAALLTILYALLKLVINGNRIKKLIYLAIGFCIFLLLTLVQWFPLVKLISLSARSLDVAGWQSAGWFLPWQNLIQFLAPDFFGNPTTLNYYGIWNYGEFIGYIGIIPLVLAMFALFFRKDKKTFFFGTVFFLSLIFALPTFFAKLPYRLEIPFLSTSQPTRLMFLTDFSLGILAALGLDYFIRTKNKRKIFYILGVIIFLFVSLWVFVLFHKGSLISQNNLSIAKHNLILPTGLLIVSFLLFLIVAFCKRNKIQKLSIILLIAVTIFDLFRFGWKFEPFVKKEYLFPKTSVTSFLQKQEQPFRVISTDPSIFPPNFSIMYKLQTLDGYDPLYVQRYGELMAALGRGEPNISSPFGFNRIITPHNISSNLIDLLNVKYILSLQELKESKLVLVYKDENISVYENNNVFPRAFFVGETLFASSKQNAVDKLFDPKTQLDKVAVVENTSDKAVFRKDWSMGKISFVKYQESKIILETDNEGDGFLVLSDTYYPTWRATVDNKEVNIFLTDYNFRGIIVPKGRHRIEFVNLLF